jgi:hypothetical protein
MTATNRKLARGSSAGTRAESWKSALSRLKEASGGCLDACETWRSPWEARRGKTKEKATGDAINAI